VGDLVIAPPLGLYSIGVRGPDAAGFLALAARWQVPHAHLRGGPRGYGLARLPASRLADCARLARESGVPVTMVTADTDLSDFTAPGTSRYDDAARELTALAGVSAQLGARAIRLLARAGPHDAGWGNLSVPASTAPGLSVLAEPHNPAWFSTGAAACLERLLDRVPGLALLLDSAQVHGAWLGNPADSWPLLLAGLAARAGVIHLSDQGAGLDGSGHRLLAQAVRAAAESGHSAEAAFEWTGADRSPQECLARYRAAAGWWAERWAEQP
jgi:hypothetical protein